MKLGIINSAFSQVGIDTKTGLEHIARIGFDSVDIFTEAWNLDPQEEKIIAKTCQSHRLPIISLPVISFGLIDFNDPVRAFHIERVKKFIDLAQRLEAHNVLLVLGEYVWQREVIPAQAQWKWALESCREIGDYAEKANISIALELEPFRLSLLNNVSEMVRFIDECAHPRIKANIDISHLVLSDCGPEELSSLRKKAIHVHISDCDGKVHGDLPPGRGIIKFHPYLAAIRELQIDGAISLELEYSPDPSQIVGWVEEAFNETQARMKACGLYEPADIKS